MCNSHACTHSSHSSLYTGASHERLAGSCHCVQPMCGCLGCMKCHCIHLLLMHHDPHTLRCCVAALRPAPAPRLLPSRLLRQWTLWPPLLQRQLQAQVTRASSQSCSTPSPAPSPRSTRTPLVSVPAAGGVQAGSGLDLGKIWAPARAIQNKL